MTLDPVKNFVRVSVDGTYNASDTSINLDSGEGAKLPDPLSEGEFNLVWFDDRNYPDNPLKDPKTEIVRVTGISNDTLTVERGKENTSATNKKAQTGDYIMILTPTAKTIDDIDNYLESLDTDGDAVVDSADKLTDGSVEVTAQEAQSHIDDTSNPHQVTQSQVGLDKVLNKAQVAKDGSEQMTGDLDMNSNQVTGLSTPQSADEAATKAYADNTTSYTDERAQDAIGGILSSQFNYDDSGDAITIDPHVGTPDAHHVRYSDEEAQDAVGAMADSTLAYGDSGPSLGVADNSLGTVKLSFDPATQIELNNHANTSDAHHAKTTSAGNAGAVQYSDGSGGFAASDTQLYVDSSTGNVGVGTNSLGAKLTVNHVGSGKPALLTTNGDTSGAGNDYAQISFGYKGNDEYNHWITSRHDGSGNDNAIDFYLNDGTQDASYPSNANHKLTVESDGIGIGTKSPDQPLHAKSDSNINLLQETTNDNSYFRFRNPTQTWVSGLRGSANGDYQHSYTIFDLSNGTPRVSVTNSGNVYLGNDSESDETMFVGAGGNVGIGTNSPNNPLHVEGSDSTLLELRDPSTDVANGNFDYSVIEWRDSQGTRDWWLGRSASGNFKLRDSVNNNDVLTAKPNGDIILDHGGRVGISETNPQNALDVNGDVTFSGNLRGNGMSQLDNESMTFQSGTRHLSLKVSDGSDTGLINAFDQNNNEFGRIIARGLDGNGGGDITFEEMGGVGIAKTNASEKLDVGGNIRGTGKLKIGGDAINDFTGNGLQVNNNTLFLPEDSVTVAGNQVSLGNSTAINHSDLSNISSDAHHARYSDEESQDAVGTILSSDFSYNDSTPQISLAANSVTVAGNAVSLGGSTAVSHADLSNISSDDHHTKPTTGSGLFGTDTFTLDESYSATWTSEQTFDVAQVMQAVTTPSAPASGYNKLYFKSDDNLYAIDSNGNENQVGGSTDTRTDVSEAGTQVVADTTDINFTESGASTVTVFDDGDGTVTVEVSSTDTDNNTQLSKEDVQDFAWDVLTGTQSLISVTYDDANDEVNFSVNSDLSQYDNSTTGFISDITAEPIGDLTDVSTSSVSSGQALTYDGSSWTNTDVATQTELNNHTSISDAHHAKYTDESAQDAVGTILSSDLSYDDATPQISLAANSVTVAGNSVSLGNSTAVNHGDLSNISSNDHHTRPQAGLRIQENSNSFDVDGAGLAGENISWDGTNNELDAQLSGDTNQKVQTGHILITSSGTKTVSGLTFQPNRVTFEATYPVHGTDNETSGSGGDDDDNYAGYMKGYATYDGSTTDQQVSATGGSGNSINAIRYFSSSSHCIGVSAGGQNGNESGQITAALASWNSDGFDLNVDTFSSIQKGSVLVQYTAYRSEELSTQATDIEDSGGVVVADSGAVAFTASGDASVSVTDDGDNTATVDISATDTQLSDEQVQDYAFNNVLSGTQTLINVSYDDANNQVDYVVDNDLSNYDNSTSGFISSVSTGDINDGAVTEAKLDVTDTPSDGEILSWNNTAGQFEWVADQTGSGGSAITLDLGNDGSNESTDLSKVTTVNDSNAIAAEPNADELRLDFSKNYPTADNVVESNVDHNSLSNYVANEHVDHSSVAVNSGTGLTGGGDLTASRTIALSASIDDLNDVASGSESAGQIPIWNGTNSQYENASISGGNNTTVTESDASITIDSTDTQLSTEQVQDYVFSNVLSGTQTLITVAYDDANNQVDYTVDSDLSNYDNSTSGFLSSVGTTDINSGAVTEAKLDATDTPSDGEILSWNNSQSQFEWVADETGSGGSAVVLDLGNDGSNESSDLSKVTTASDSNSIATSPNADELRLDFSQNYPTADNIDNGTLSTSGSTITSTGGVDVGLGGTSGDDLNVDSGGFVYESDTGRVGVNKPSPSGALVAQSAGSESPFILRNSSGNKIYEIKDQGVGEGVLSLNLSDGQDANTSSLSSLDLGTTLNGSSLYTVNASSVDVSEDGTYRLYVNVATRDATASRTNPVVSFAVNGTKIAGRGQDGYTRSREGHDEGSSQLSRTVSLSSGDTIEVQTQEIASGGTAPVDGNESIFRIEKVSAYFSRPLADADTFQGLAPTDFVQQGDSATLTEITMDGQTFTDLTGNKLGVSASNQLQLKFDTVTVAGNSVTLGNSTSVNHSDLSNISSNDHHTRPSAGVRINENSNSFDIDGSGLAGDNVSWDSTNNELDATDTNTQLSDEEVQDYVFNNVLSGTQTLITVSYDDANNQVDYVVDNDLSNYDNSTSGFISSPGGSDTQIQYNDGGSFSGIPSLTYDSSSGELSLDANGSGRSSSDFAFSPKEATELSGTVDGSALSTTLTGSSTAFTSELSTSDRVLVGSFVYEIDTITSDTELDLATGLREDVSSASIFRMESNGFVEFRNRGGTGVAWQMNEAGHFGWRKSGAIKAPIHINQEYTDGVGNTGILLSHESNSRSLRISNKGLQSENTNGEIDINAQDGSVQLQDSVGINVQDTAPKAELHIQSDDVDSADSLNEIRTTADQKAGWVFRERHDISGGNAWGYAMYHDGSTNELVFEGRASDDAANQLFTADRDGFFTSDLTQKGSGLDILSRNDAGDVGTRIEPGSIASEYLGQELRISGTDNVKFDTWDSGSSSFDEKMRLTQDGKFGVQTDSPSTAFEAAGTATVTGIKVPNTAVVDEFNGAGLANSSGSLNVQERFCYDTGHTSWDENLSNKEVNRIVLQSGETLVVERIELRQEGGGSSTDMSIRVQDTTSSTTIGSQNLGGTTKNPGSSGTGNTVQIQVDNDTGSPVNASIRVTGYITGA